METAIKQKDELIKANLLKGMYGMQDSVVEYKQHERGAKGEK
jgi:hypothetical protein